MPNPGPEYCSPKPPPCASTKPWPPPLWPWLDKFKSVGVKAQGRTKILHITYRNTEKILGIAYEFAKELLTPTEGQDDDAPVLVKNPAMGGA